MSTEAASRDLVGLLAWLVEDTLDGRDAMILRMRLGLGGESPHTLVQAAARLRVSPERVRQVINRSFVKIKSRMTILSRAGDPRAVALRSMLEASFEPGNVPVAQALVRRYAPELHPYETTRLILYLTGTPLRLTSWLGVRRKRSSLRRVWELPS